MAIASYTDLLATIPDFMNRQDATAAIPGFITLAEAEMNRKLRVRQMVARVYANLSAEFETVPADFCGEMALTLEGTASSQPLIQLEYCDADKIAYENSLSSSQSGVPARYSIQGSDLQLSPAPSASYLAHMVYYAAIPPLSPSRTANWLLTKYPDAYLYGALSHAGMWLRGDPRKDDFVTTFETILSNIQDANKVEADAPRLEIPTRFVA